MVLLPYCHPPFGPHQGRFNRNIRTWGFILENDERNIPLLFMKLLSFGCWVLSNWKELIQSPFLQECEWPGVKDSVATSSLLSLPLSCPVFCCGGKKHWHRLVSFLYLLNLCLCGNALQLGDSEQWTKSATPKFQDSIPRQSYWNEMPVSTLKILCICLTGGCRSTFPESSKRESKPRVACFGHTLPGF